MDLVSSVTVQPRTAAPPCWSVVGKAGHRSLARHTCGVTTGGEAYCWGLNSDGQLGDGTGTNRSVPVKVTIPW